ncbi:hypothetical protein H5410_016665 [Solanum commersonii]|uniref:Uncharacterized protein n=1 Tax=Solanum commersonii TaxID=4109 RepID=A0A9J5ZX42_SOLCO|nr:hypothetical protein H5410_016665 [Solanum commersonii]
MVPTENQNLALNSRLTCKRSSGSTSIFRKGGNGNPKNLAVADVNGGMYNFSTSKSIEISSLDSILFPVPVPVPPCALYTKSGYFAFYVNLKLETTWPISIHELGTLSSQGGQSGGSLCIIATMHFKDINIKNRIFVSYSVCDDV